MKNLKLNSEQFADQLENRIGELDYEKSKLINDLLLKNKKDIENLEKMQQRKADHVKYFHEHIMKRLQMLLKSKVDKEEKEFKESIDELKNQRKSTGSSKEEIEEYYSLVKSLCPKDQTLVKSLVDKFIKKEKLLIEKINALEERIDGLIADMNKGDQIAINNMRIMFEEKDLQKQMIITQLEAELQDFLSGSNFDEIINSMGTQNKKLKQKIQDLENDIDELEDKLEELESTDIVKMKLM